MLRTLRLSKSRFTSGLQCHRQLWWKVHEPDAPELVPDVVTRKLFDQGARIGVEARGHVPGGVLIDLPHDAFDERVKATKKALAQGANVVYEASFACDDAYVAVDIVERTDQGLVLIEVKSSLAAKSVHIQDAAIQRHVVESAGYRVAGVQILHLNRACTAPDLSDLFERTDVTAEVDDFLAYVPDRIGEMLAMLGRPVPKVAIGAHCHAPYACPFKARCWDQLPPHHVTTMYAASGRAWEWAKKGYHTVLDLPGTTKLSPVGKRQWKAIHRGRRIVEPGLAARLEALPRPLAFLDFETIMPAVPRWPGDRPYTQVPVQFSVHRERPEGGFEHVAFLADGREDPRPAIGEAVRAALEEARTVVTYNMSFERMCLERIADAPGSDRRVRWLVPKLADLLPIVREHVYDPAFLGSFSLKSVVPVLVPDLSYADLAITDGAAASALLDRLLGSNLPEEERAQLRSDLLAYCERDTWATVRLFEALEELSAAK